MTTSHFESLGSVPYEYIAPLDMWDHAHVLPRTCQDLFIGSGPGASVVSAYLAKSGRNVVVLEEGPARDEKAYSQYLAADAFGRMYRTLGGYPVLGGPGTPPMVLVVASCKGGGTVVNGAVCYRTSTDVIDHWKNEVGLDMMSREVWAGYERAEKRIGVTSMGELHSGAALKARAGAEMLGWAHHDVKRNTPGCKGASRCLQGCPNNAKQSMLLTYLKDAENAGAEVFSDTRVTRLEGGNGSVKVVRGVRNGKPFEIHAERVFLGAGALYSPFLMLKSGIRDLRAIGRHLTVHPTTRAYYVYDEPVNAYEGAFQSFAIHQFRNEGIHLINLFPTPNAFAASLPAVGSELRTMLNKIPNMGIMGGLISDESEGRVHALPFFESPFVTYNMNRTDKKKLLRTIGLLGKLGFASGAKEVYLPFNWRPSVKNEAELEAMLASEVAPHDFELTAQHPMGTCRMGYDEDLSVVREDGRVHGYDNLYVVDSSVIPSSIGVNPMLTILAVAEVIGQALTA